MSKISDFTSLTGAGVDTAADVLPIIDHSETGTARNKKITVAELLGLVAVDSEAIDDRVAALLTAGTNITLTYDDGAGTLTIDAAGGGGGSGTVTSVATAGLATGGPITGTGTVTVTAATASDVKTGTSTSTAVTPGALADSAAPQTLADGANIDWNMASGYNAKVTLGGNRTLNTPTNPKVGQTYSLAVIQDGTGSRTMTWPSAFDWGTTGAPTLTTTAAKVDQFIFVCSDAATPKFRAILSGKGFSA